MIYQDVKNGIVILVDEGWTNDVGIGDAFESIVRRGNDGNWVGRGIVIGEGVEEVLETVSKEVVE